jgi:hypothetical protein
MNTKLAHGLARSLAVAVAAALFAACGESAPVEATQTVDATPKFATHEAIQESVVAAIRRATAPYHDIERARKDQFVLLHPCEDRPGEGPVGTVYVNLARLTDGKIDINSPDALIYEPQANGRLVLVGAEFATPYGLAPGGQPPKLLGHTFQDETEFQVFALHAWVWRKNPTGMFEETNPLVSCGKTTG